MNPSPLPVWDFPRANAFFSWCTVLIQWNDLKCTYRELVTFVDVEVCYFWKLISWCPSEIWHIWSQTNIHFSHSIYTREQPSSLAQSTKTGKVITCRTPKTRVNKLQDQNFKKRKRTSRSQLVVTQNYCNAKSNTRNTTSKQNCI